MTIIQQIEQNTLAIRNASAAFDRLNNMLTLCKSHLSNFMDTFEARIDNDQTFSYNELNDYVEACKFMRRFGRENDRMNDAEEKMLWL